MELLNQAMANLEFFWAYRFSRKNRGLNFYSMSLWLSKSEICSSFFLSGRKTCTNRMKSLQNLRDPPKFCQMVLCQKIALIGRKEIHINSLDGPVSIHLIWSGDCHLIHM